MSKYGIEEKKWNFVVKKGILEEKFMVDVSYRGTCGYKSIILFSMLGIVCCTHLYTHIYNKTKKKESQIIQIRAKECQE